MLFHIIQRRNNKKFNKNLTSRKNIIFQEIYTPAFLPQIMIYYAHQLYEPVSLNSSPSYTVPCTVKTWTKRLDQTILKYVELCIFLEFKKKLNKNNPLHIKAKYVNNAFKSINYFKKSIESKKYRIYHIHKISGLSLEISKISGLSL